MQPFQANVLFIKSNQIMELYVSNLMPEVTEEELNRLLAVYGKVTSYKLIVDKNTGMSRSFAFVEMPQQAEANKAMTELVCRNTDGTCIIVEEAKPRSAGRAF